MLTKFNRLFRTRAVTWQHQLDWPDLPKEGFVAGRPANDEDVAIGRAVFVLKSEGISVGRPLELPVPKYALHRDIETGLVTPGIVIQAEEAVS